MTRYFLILLIIPYASYAMESEPKRLKAGIQKGLTAASLVNIAAYAIGRFQMDGTIPELYIKMLPMEHQEQISFYTRHDNDLNKALINSVQTKRVGHLTADLLAMSADPNRYYYLTNYYSTGSSSWKNSKEPIARPLLSQSILKKNKKAFSALLSHPQTDLDARDKESEVLRPHFTPLLHATESNQEDYVNQLIQSGADVNSCDSDGLSPLMIASYNNNPLIAKLLLDNKAAADHQALGTTALIYSIENKYPKMVSLLLESGANVNLRNSRGLSPLSAARAQKKQNPEIIKELKKYGAIE